MTGSGASEAPTAGGRRLSVLPGTLDAVDALWTTAASTPAAARLASESGISRLIAEILVARGISTPSAARAFLEPDPAALHDSGLLKGAEEAAARLGRAARAGRRIVVFGDYDVDGVTSVAQLRAALRRAGADAVAFLPHRLRDGYGLRPETVRRVLADLSPGVIVTVDCGITAVEGVACARAAGVDVIVTDHHLVPDELPAGAVVVNPRQPGCDYPEKELAACGIAMKISEAVARRAGVSLSRESLLRAAALGTIADLVPLLGENRVIAAAGLAALATSRAPGLRALLAEAGVAPGCAPTAEEVAFRIAPRLNAAGRIDGAELALALFEERDAARAEAIARELSARNAERQSLERRVTAAARELAAAECDLENDAAILLAAPGWHRGVLGIAASRLAREWHRPVILFAIEGDRARGSGRSVPGVSLHGTLMEIEGVFDEFGGHDQAVGGSLPAARFPELRAAALALFAARSSASARRPVARADARLDLEDVSPELVAALSLLEPHGMGNPRPVFAARVRPAGRFRALGASGVRGRLRRSGGDLDCIAWRPDAALAGASEGDAVDVHFSLRAGWKGEPEVEVLAARPATESAAPAEVCA